MVYHLTFEDMNQLLKPQIILSPSDQLSHAPNIASHVLLPSSHLNSNNNIAARPPACLSENSNSCTLMQCMQKLAGHYPSPHNSTVGVALQESKGQILMSAASSAACKVQLEGSGDHEGPQHIITGSGATAAAPAGAAAAAGSAACTPRPRWCPTPEQIQVLEALFNSGTTTPSRDMIVEIAGCLKQFGSIVEANVFYWFQNRKARAKRKLRMQAAQLNQQQAASAAPTTTSSSGGSPTNSNGCPASSHYTGGKSSTSTGTRRVCAKTASKTSPASDADHYLPRLLHLPAAPAHHSHDHRRYQLDLQAADTCSNFTVHDIHHRDPLAATAAPCDGLIREPQSVPQMIGNTISCRMRSSSYNGADQRLSLCTLSNAGALTSVGINHAEEKHAHNHVMRQSAISNSGPHIAAVVLSPLAGDDHLHEQPDHDYSPATTQNHNECISRYPHIMSSLINVADANYLPANIVSATCSSSRPGSAESNDVIVGSSCSPKSVMEGHNHHDSASLFQTTPSTFLVSSSAQSLYSSVTEANPLYSSQLALAHISPSTLYHDTMQESFSLPNKRSWMDALIQQFNVSQTACAQRTQLNCTTTSAAPSNAINHDLYSLDAQARAQANEMLNIKHIDQDQYSPTELSLLQLQKPQINSSQGTLMILNNASPLTHLSADSMVPGAQSVDHVIKEDNQNANTTAVCSKKYKLASSAAEAFHQELYGQDHKRRDHPANLESLEPQQEQIMINNNVTFSTTSPLTVNHHCDNLPLWEALAPYMSIGS